MSRNVINERGDFILTPKPQGISGGPVWRVRFSREGLALDARVVGIATEYREIAKCAIATRIWVAVNLARSVFPDLARHLPRSTTFREPSLFSGALRRTP